MVETHTASVTRHCQILGLDPAAIRAVIVGVVDEVDLSESASPRDPFSRT